MLLVITFLPPQCAFVPFRCPQCIGPRRCGCRWASWTDAFVGGAFVDRVPDLYPLGSNGCLIFGGCR